jgi:replication initiator protein RepSA
MAVACPELWRRFCIALQRDLAARCRLTVPEFRRRCVISYSKVVEFQARGVIHVHVPIRLDGADGPDGPGPAVVLTTGDLEDAIHATAARVVLDSEPLPDQTVYRLRWGAQVDTRTITDTADQQTRSPRQAHPRQVAAYLAKYLTKITEDLGLPQRVHSAAHASSTGASVHAVRLIETAEQLAEHGGGSYARLLAHLASLRYRGHPITKSRGYSVTFGQIRRVKWLYRARPAGLGPDADIRQLIDDQDDMPEGFVVVSSWVFAGQGYLDLDAAAAAVRSAAVARTR